MAHQMLLWGSFGTFVLTMLALDLGVFHRHARVVDVKEALRWSAMWIALALLFNLGVYLWYGTDAALAFLTGYVLEESLSVDNLFVFLMILSYFSVPLVYQHKVLFWGILGALIMRAIFIAAGVGLIQRFHWIVYVFGAFLVYSGIKLFRQGEAEIHPERNPVLRLLRRWVPVTKDYEGDKFFVQRTGLLATPLLVVLVVVETTDLLFAVDSIPAILAITRDAFIVYTSNVFAILGLRSMYFALAGMMEMFRYLHYGLSVVLVFVGAKMLLSHYYEVPTVVALGAVAGILLLSVAASLLKPNSA